jgi:8-oxo-dGTP pyrophosphatase MutT (NUDIX family)
MTEIEASIVVVENVDGLFLILKRTSKDRSYPGKWCFPGGRLDEREEPETAAMRELLEETGISQESIVDFSFSEIQSSDLPARNRTYNIHIFRAVVSTTEITLSDEHEDFVFVSPKDGMKYDLAGKVSEDIFRSLNGQRALR